MNGCAPELRGVFSEDDTSSIRVRVRVDRDGKRGEVAQDVFEDRLSVQIVGHIAKIMKAERPKSRLKICRVNGQRGKKTNLKTEVRAELLEGVL